MDAAAIEQRLRTGEDARTEFKSASPDLSAKTLAKELVAFANSRGGQIFLGVEDDGAVTGVGDLRAADQLMQKVSSACQTSVEPALSCAIIKVEVAGKIIVVVDLPAFNTDRPYRADHVYYLRDGTVCREATRVELDRMLQSQNVYLRSLKCVDEDKTPTVAGVLFFGRDPQQWLPDARISAVRFSTSRPSTNFVDRREITGTLTAQIEGAVAFLRHHVPAPSRLEGWTRVERGLPDVVLREAVLNALSHRDYRAASQVRIFVYEDRVEVINAGLLLNHLTLDSIRLGGISQRRNPIIATLLSRAGRRESLGVGVPEMIGLMKERALPEPEFDLSGGHFRVVLRWVS